MKKRLAAITLCLILIVSMVAGCGNSGKTTEPAPEEANAEGETGNEGDAQDTGDDEDKLYLVYVSPFCPTPSGWWQKTDLTPPVKSWAWRATG